MVEFTVLVASVGVGLLLLAFFLNLFKILTYDSKSYIIMNIFGAGIACYASILIGFIPFVILEGTWAIVALIGLIKLYRR
jgi:hypothetical protein